MAQIIWRNKKIFYDVKGDGAPVMLVHGFAENGKVWDEMVSELSGNFKIIVPDLPGSGTSEFVDEELRMTDYADALAAIVRAEINSERETFTMIGHSMGGYIALAFADKHPELLNGLGLFHSTSFADTPDKKKSRLSAITEIQAKGKTEYLKNSLPKLFSEHSRNHFPEMIDNLIKLAEETKKEALVQYQQAMMNRKDRQNLLKSTNIPVIFIQGVEDSAIPVEDGLKQAHMPGICHFHLLERSGHFGMWEEKEKCAKILFKYLHSANNPAQNL